MLTFKFSLYLPSGEVVGGDHIETEGFIFTFKIDLLCFESISCSLKPWLNFFCNFVLILFIAGVDSEEK